MTKELVLKLFKAMDEYHDPNVTIFLDDGIDFKMFLELLSKYILRKRILYSFINQLGGGSLKDCLAFFAIKSDKISAFRPNNFWDQTIWHQSLLNGY